MKSHRSLSVEQLVRKWIDEGYSGTASAGRITTNYTEFHSNGVVVAKRFAEKGLIAVKANVDTRARLNHKKKIIDYANQQKWKIGRM